MDCIEARQHISTGLRPGSRTAVQAQLGFHVAGCESCRRALAAQPPVEDPLLTALLAAAANPGHPGAAPDSQSPPARRALPLLAACAILGMMALIWSVNVLMQGKPLAGAESARANPGNEIRLVPLANGGIGTAGPAAEPAGQQAPGNASAAPPTATATPAPTAVPVPTATPAAPLRPINVLLLGLDRRPGETEISRSDSLMIIHIDPLSPSLALLSLPRDLWVTLPGTEQWVKINAAYSHGEEAGGPAGGAQAAKATIEQVIAQPIDYTLVTTFEGMIGMVDAIGGIDINVPQALVDTSFPNFDYSTMTAQFEAGPQPMDGFWALVYSRTRHPDSDFQRIRRQQLVLLAMFARLQGLADAGQPPELAALAARLQGSFEYSDLDPAEALRLAGALDGLDLAGVRREAIDLRYGAETSTIDGAYIIMPDTAAIQRVAAELFGN